MIIFGLTGGIACGKSTVSSYWNKKYQIPIIDGDLINRKIVEPGSPCLNEIIKVFGNSYLNYDETLNRELLGKLVFADSEKREQLENIMRVYFGSQFSDECTKLSWAGHKIVCFDWALIKEQQVAVKPLVVVTSTEQNQIKRLIARNNLTEQEARQRINSQLSSEEKVKNANYVIENDFTNSILEEQADKILMKLISDNIK